MSSAGSCAVFCVTPPPGTEMLLQRTYAEKKIPSHTHAKHISTNRNQSTEAQW